MADMAGAARSEGAALVAALADSAVVWAAASAAAVQAEAGRAEFRIMNEELRK
jgi:hypothetical protein